jgi:transcriptional repressor NrdR
MKRRNAHIWLLHLFYFGAFLMRCPYCKHHDSKVLDTSHDSHGGIRRRRECLKCRQRFSSYERPILATPLLIKQDGAREEFDREKLARGIRISCAKRPVSAADIERMIGQVETQLQKLGKAEVSSRVVGDLVMTTLKEVDQIAYIRYAIVYLGLDDLQSIRKEIDLLLED